MPKINKKDVKHVAKLANLELSEKEVEKFSRQLSSVVSFIDTLKKVDVKGVVPTSQTTGLKNVMRKDELDSKTGLTQKEALSDADKTYNGYFVTKRLVAKD
jgi:aspartyl-tRNA(Asn)/glutamyl-tRNA(Gln) amidotransferase subunit C